MRLFPKYWISMNFGCFLVWFQVTFRFHRKWIFAGELILCYLKLFVIWASGFGFRWIGSSDAVRWRFCLRLSGLFGVFPRWCRSHRRKNSWILKKIHYKIKKIQILYFGNDFRILLFIEWLGKSSCTLFEELSGMNNFGVLLNFGFKKYDLSRQSLEGVWGLGEGCVLEGRTKYLLTFGGEKSKGFIIRGSL